MSEDTDPQRRTTAECYRPEMHATADYGVLMAPAAALLDDDTWHLFYQYSPEGGAAPRWGHQVSRETPYEWEVCDDVIAPIDGEVLVHAGSVAVVDGGVNLYFTSVTADGNSIHLARLADPEATTTDVSNDPVALDSHVERRGVMADDALGADHGLKDFRCPCVVAAWSEQTDGADDAHPQWLMLTATGSGENPRLVVLRSDDAVHWRVDGPMSFDGDPGFSQHWAYSPRIVHLRDEVDGELYDILLVTIGTDDIDISGYLVGRLHGARFEVVHPFRRIDYGHDFIRPRTATSTNPSTLRHERGILFGVVDGVSHQVDAAHLRVVENEDRVSAVSLPRMVSLQGGTLYQTPAPGLVDAITRTEAARMWTGLCEITHGSSLTVDIVDSEGSVAARVTHRGDVLELDRSMNPHHRGDPVATAPLAEGDSDSLTIVADGCAVEIFADGGLVAMASRVYIDGDAPEFKVQTTGAAEVRSSFVRGPETISPVVPDWAKPGLGREFR